jgi:DNA polymerase-1
MIRIPGALTDAKLPARMLLQVHDELLFEVDDSAVEQTITVVKNIMERAALPVLDLDVPLVVDARQGENWAQAH